MRPKRSGRQTLLLPLALLAGPLLLLAIMAARFIQRDKYTVEKEAQERATEMARRLVRSFSFGFTEEAMTLATEPGRWDSNLVILTVDQTNGLFFPPPLQRAEPLADMDASSMKVLREAESAEYRGTNPGAALRIYSELLATNLPAPLRALGRFHRATLLDKSGETNAALGEFRDLKGIPFAHRLETGWPIAGLAALKELEICRASNSMAECSQLAISLASNLVRSPTEYSEFLLGRLEQWKTVIEPYAVEWTNMERARAIHSADVGGSHGKQRVSFFYHDEEKWFGIPASESNLVYRTAESLEALRAECVTNATLPGYFETRFTDDEGKVTFAGKTKESFDKESAVFAVATLESITPLRCEIYLTDASALFAEQQRRARWLGALLFGASAIAGIGIFHTLRTQRAQARLNELKSNFVSSVSHELRAPLGSMRLISEGLQSGRVRDPEKQREYYNYLVQECRRLSALVENVLDFSRMEQNRKEYALEETNLASVVKSAIATLEPLAHERGVRLELPVEGANEGNNDFHVVADALAIQQAVLNLLDNAIKHSPLGETVRVELAATESAVTIAVTDHGPGIPASEHKRIFEWFYRLGSEIRRETAGVGIGLTIVKHIVEAHGGRIEVESAPGKGSTFGLIIPKKDGSAK